ncbi:DUF3747 domain-containing protein [Allocoleopsis sp.]|uniref:DUF3747 domain-containing protein n=1 Tax=Allocoleopsis sp. TaxID=3088169 RepID=UPI002FD55474
MKISQGLGIAGLAVASCLSVGAFNPTTAATFDSAEVKGDNFIAVAAPYGENKHQLLIIEQLSNRRPCWSENGSNPVSVDPLLLNFDFTGICGRSTDSNGYSLRMSGEDLGLEYILRIVERNGDLVLVGTPRINRSAPEIEIGSTQGMSNGFAKIILNPGWRFTRRTYQGKSLGHIYLTTDSPAPVASELNTTPRPLPTSQPALSSPPPPLSVPPERELIFTRPGDDSTAPSVEVPSPPIPSSPSTPERQIPVFTVPTQ